MLNRSNTQHIFVLMLENHSFDSLLGWSGISGTDVVTGAKRTLPKPSGNESYEGITYVPTNPALNPMPVDPGHEFTDTVEQLCGANSTYPYGGPYPPIANNGFVANYAYYGGGTVAGSHVDDALRGFAPSQVPVITALGQSFCICDRWFSSMPGPTWPNRFFVHAASTGGLDHSPTTAEFNQWMSTGYNFQNGTIFDRLEAKQLPWCIYAHDHYPQAYALANMTTYWEQGHGKYFTEFVSDVNSGSYAPVYTFIEPNYGAFFTDCTCGTSQHPLDDITRGEWLIKCTFEAIRNSPVWETSLLIVTYDEHGGFFDSVVTPEAVPPADQPSHPEDNASGFPFNLYGVRVPTIIVSPYIQPNVLDGRNYDHTSVLATLERIFDLEPLTMRDRTANDLTSLGTLTEPTGAAPAYLPSPAPGVQFPQCGPMTGCGEVAQTFVANAYASGIDDDLPLTGNQAGFLHVALRRDLSASAEPEQPQRIARAQAVTTRGELRRYVMDLEQRLTARGI